MRSSASSPRSTLITSSPTTSRPAGSRRGGPPSAACATAPPSVPPPAPLSRSQEREHSQHPPVIVIGRGQVELAEDARDVLLDRAGRDDHGPGDGGVGPPLGHQLEDLPLARRQLRQRRVARLPRS